MVEVSFGITGKADTITINFDGTKDEAIGVYGLRNPDKIPPIIFEDGTWFETKKESITWLKIREMPNKPKDDTTDDNMGKRIPD